MNTDEKDFYQALDEVLECAWDERTQLVVNGELNEVRFDRLVAKVAKQFGLSQEEWHILRGLVFEQRPWQDENDERTWINA